MCKRYLSFLLALVMVLIAVPAMAITGLAAETSLTKDVWNGGSGVTATLGNRGGAYSTLGFYQWYAPDGTVLREQNNEDSFLVSSDGYYAKINPMLYTVGILDEDATYEEQIAQYRAYVEGAGHVSYPSNWTIEALSMQGTTRETIDRLAMFNAKSIYGIRGSSSNTKFTVHYWHAGMIGTSSVVDAYLENYFATALTPAVKPDADGKIYAKDLVSALNSGTLLGADWASDAAVLVTGDKLADGNRTMYLVPYSGANGLVAYTYTVPKGLNGDAQLSIESLAFNSGSSVTFAVLLNGEEVIYPAEGERNNINTWKVITVDDVDTVNAELAAIEGLTLREGDTISFALARTQGNRCEVDMRPAVDIDRKYLVKFIDHEGNEIYSETVEPGAPMPAAPIASKDGFYVNFGPEPVTVLPETVSENTIIQYAGDFKIDEILVEKASISIANDFSINLYLRGDVNAVKIGCEGYLSGYDIPEAWGEAQEDGTYKISIPAIAVQDLGEDIELYLYQEFKGGYEIENTEPYYVNPLEVLETYTTDADYADVKDLARAALDYYAAADAYFNGGELDVDIAARLAAQDAAIAALAKDAPISGDGDYTIKAATLVLEEKVGVKLSVELTEWGFLGEQDLALSVRMDYEEYTGFTMKAGSSDTAMVITLPGISPADFDEELEITVMDNGDEVSGTLTYSVNAYIARTFEGGEGETDDLLRALYALYAATK